MQAQQTKPLLGELTEKDIEVIMDALWCGEAHEVSPEEYERLAKLARLLESA